MGTKNTQIGHQKISLWAPGTSIWAPKHGHQKYANRAPKNIVLGTKKYRFGHQKISFWAPKNIVLGTKKYQFGYHAI
jgi:hypothetical protein